MSTAALLGFVAVAVLGVITPGLDTMLVLRHSLLSGTRVGLAAVVGISLGCLVWGTASIAGLTALLTASRLAYDTVRVLGAIYLLWLGGSALWKSFRASPGQPHPLTEQRPAGHSPWSALRAGTTTNLLNPKVGVFYMSLLPQFLPVGPTAASWGALLVAIHVGVGLLWLPGLVWAASRARRLLLRDRVRRWLDRVTATVLIALGIKLATEG